MDIDTRVFPIRRHQVSSDRNRTLAYYKKKAIMRSEMKDYGLRYSYAPQTRYAHMDCFSRQHNGNVA